MKPEILISATTNQENYVNAVTKCGAIATALRYPEFSNEYDGLILSGGGDIHPDYYNEEINGSKNIDTMRDEAEFKLVKAFVQKKKPILGICRGHQLLNVAFGGSLYQHISNADLHSSGIKGVDLVHDITVSKDSFFYNLYGERFSVNSSHHQAVKKLGEGFEVIGTTHDGTTIEAISHKVLPIIAVQWHPERMCFDKKRDDAVDGEKIIRHFLKLCK